MGKAYVEWDNKQRYLIAKIMEMTNDKTLFQQYRKIVDGLEIGEKITRQEVIHRLGLKENKSSVGTVDNYRRAFEKASYLKYEGLGLYSKLRPLDCMSTTMTKLKEENKKFLDGIGGKESWSRKTNEDLEKENHWRRKWMESGIPAEEFIKKYRGTIHGEKYGI
jgi:hypothetical protein